MKQNTLFSKESLSLTILYLDRASILRSMSALDNGPEVKPLHEAKWLVATIMDDVFDYNPYFCCVFFNFLLAFNFLLLVSDIPPSDIVAKTFILRILFFPNFKTLERMGKKRRRWGCLGAALFHKKITTSEIFL